jgi:hypothetical protein
MLCITDLVEDCPVIAVGGQYYESPNPANATIENYDRLLTQSVYEEVVSSFLIPQISLHRYSFDLSQPYVGYLTMLATIPAVELDLGPSLNNGFLFTTQRATWKNTEISVDVLLFRPQPSSSLSNTLNFSR